MLLSSTDFSLEIFSGISSLNSKPEIFCSNAIFGTLGSLQLRLAKVKSGAENNELLYMYKQEITFFLQSS